MELAGKIIPYYFPIDLALVTVVGVTDMTTIHPTVHGNGTPASTLIDQREAVWYALENAYQALKQMAPNPRDYEDIEAATEQHMRRLGAVDSLKAEIADEMVVLSVS